MSVPPEAVLHSRLGTAWKYASPIRQIASMLPAGYPRDREVKLAKLGTVTVISVSRTARP